MDKFLESVMNFINENTTLLIIICVFLIFVLIGYLIDNSIKTRRLAKQELAKKSNPSVEPEVQNTIVEETKVVEETPIEEEVTPVEVTTPEVSEEVSMEVPVEEMTSVKEEVNENTIEVPVVPIEIPKVEEVQPVEVKANEITIDPEINKLLSRDFTKETTPVVNVEKDIPSVEITKEEPKVTEVKEEKSKYKNSKSLSEILAAKKEPKKTEAELMNTVDFQNELDRLLKELNSQDLEDNSSESNLEETKDFTNMF